MSDWKAFKEEVLEDPATRAAYEARKPAYELASRLIEMRNAAGLSQRELAARVGLPQPAIARIETAAVVPRWDTVAKIVAGLGGSIEIRSARKSRKPAGAASAS